MSRAGSPQWRTYVSRRRCDAFRLLPVHHTVGENVLAAAAAGDVDASRGSIPEIAALLIQARSIGGLSAQ
jgi:hypothetical protein